MSAISRDGRGGLKGSVGLASLYLIAMHDPHRAAPEIRASLQSVQWFGYDKLLNTAEVQKWPEEIGTDADWLAVWPVRWRQVPRSYAATSTYST